MPDLSLLDERYLACFALDVSSEQAIAAHRGTSFVPEKRGQQEIDGYVSEVKAILFMFYPKISINDDATLGAFWQTFNDFRGRYSLAFGAYLSAKGRCVSTMIAGPANFNTGRARKSSDSADRACEALIELREKWVKALRKIVFPNEAPIMSGDANAVERLRAKLKEAEHFQEEGKEINAAIREAKRHNENPITVLRARGIAAARCAELVKPDSLGRVGIPDYALANNSAEIRRLKARIETVSRAKSAPTTEEFHVETGIALVDVPEANRVRLKFPGKPAAEVRAELKAHGFRWAPTVDGGVWQAYRNDRALAHAREVAGGTAAE